MQVNFKQKPEEALKYFRSKGLKAQFSHLDNSAVDHARDFMVAKMMDLDLLSDVRAAVDDAINHGLAFDDFKKHLTEVMQQKGWWGKQEMADPVTGELREVQLGSPRRLKTIFDVNLSTAYAAGHWQKIKTNAKDNPYLMYNAVDDARTRPQHRSWDNKILRWDNPWWQTHYPPNGWHCRCTVIALNDDDLVEMGRNGPDPTPGEETKAWTNPRTGSVEKIPVGIDPGWAHNVGENYLQQLGMQMAEKAAMAPARLGVATVATVTDPVMEALNQNWNKFLADFDPSQTQGRRAIVGYLGEDVIDALAEIDVVPQAAGIAMEDRGLAHILRGSKKATSTKTGKPKNVSLDELQNLPDLMAYPQAILLEKDSGALIYVVAAERREAAKFVVRVNYAGKDEKYTRIATASLIDWADIAKEIDEGDKPGRKLKLIRGKL